MSDLEGKNVNVITKRVQGRPVRGIADVGRERLVEAARAIMREPKKPEISRKAVADAAGVTPALVSYYFPDKSSLVLSATQPVITQRIVELFAIMDGTSTYQDKLQGVVALFVSLGEAETHLINYVIEYCKCDGSDQTQRALLIKAYGRLRQFVLAGAAAGAWRELDPDLFLFALWGMCRCAATPPDQEGHFGPTVGSAAKTAQRVATILELSINGIARR